MICAVGGSGSGIVISDDAIPPANFDWDSFSRTRVFWVTSSL